MEIDDETFKRLASDHLALEALREAHRAIEEQEEHVEMVTSPPDWMGKNLALPLAEQRLHELHERYQEVFRQAMGPARPWGRVALEVRRVRLGEGRP